MGQEAVNVKIDVDRELYPVHDEDAYMSSDSNAIIGATYMNEPYSSAGSVLAVMKSQMNIEGAEQINLPESKAPLSGIKGVVLDEFGEEMFMELYIIEANKGAGVILIMSGYRLADKAIYGAEGKKAALSAVIAK
jgi:hypothetical protein